LLGLLVEAGGVWTKIFADYQFDMHQRLNKRQNERDAAVSLHADICNLFQ
jgi:hypothetical protein